MSDPTTIAWARNPADERAASRGCRFNVERGSHAVWWIERICRLYEGEYAGQPMILHGCRTCDKKYPVPEHWFIPGIKKKTVDPKTLAVYTKRANEFAACVAAGHELDWQYEYVMRRFGWVMHSAEYKCEIRRFTRSGVWVAKKNKKTPTLAATALYVFCGDNEPGQKVYLAAKDGEQAKIAGLHVVKMFEASAELSEACTLNKTLMQLVYHETNSIIKPISSGDSRAKKTKEGLNGSVFVDETHVVDADYMSVLEFAGISRREPCHDEFSTAGDNPASYGFAQFEYGQKVNTGEIDDDRYLFMGYFAPQSVADAELQRDPIKYGKMSNPAWGNTVKESEFLEAFKRSLATPVAFADFKKYRLNIWQKAAVVWLPPGAWEANERPFDETSLLGRACYGGLDLSKTTDTTALALIFPEDDGTFKLLVWYWLPKATALKLERKTKHTLWARDGWIELTEGDVVDYQYVRQQINDIRSKFDLKKLAFDGTYAEQMMQRLSQEDGMDVRDQIKFPQTILEFAGPTAAMERHVIAGKLHNDGNPLLAWQAGHTNVVCDRNQNKRPVKQKHGDIRTIDGPVAAIMALDMVEKFHTQYAGGGCEVW